MKGSAPFAELLLKAGAQKDLQDSEGFTPLNTAIEQGHPEVAKVLLARGANPNLATRSGQTPMHTAAGCGNVEMVRLLLDHGAALHALQNAGTPLSLAVSTAMSKQSNSCCNAARSPTWRHRKTA